MHRNIAMLVLAATFALAAPVVAVADTVDIYQGSTVSHYDGVVVNNDQQNIVGRLDFGSVGYSTAGTKVTPVGVDDWTVVINGTVHHDCQIVSHHHQAQHPESFAFVCL